MPDQANIPENIDKSIEKKVKRAEEPEKEKRKGNFPFFSGELLRTELGGEGTEYDKRKIMLLLWISIGMICFFVLLKLGMIVVVNSQELQISEIRKQAEEIRVSISKDEDVQKDAVDFVKNTQAVKKILDNHVYWTRLLAFLEKNTIDDVYFKDFAASLKSQITLRAVGKNYASAARQLLAFQTAEGITDVRIGSISAIMDLAENTALKLRSVAFDITISVNQDIFYKK